MRCARRKQTNTQRRDNPIVESKHDLLRCQNGSSHDAVREENKRLPLEYGPAWLDSEREASDTRLMERVVCLSIGLEMRVVQYTLFDQRLSLSIEADKQTRAANRRMVTDSCESDGLIRGNKKQC